MITALILTLNEELHIERCISSLTEVCSEIIVIDSFSTDKTIDICQALGAEVIQHEFISHSDQFNWALENIPLNNKWIFRIDADEYLSKELRSELIKLNLTNLGSNVNGISINRLMYFMGKPLRKGGMYPIKHLRIFKVSYAYCEKRLMDEHIVLKEGRVNHINGDIIDHNLNSISWWVSKHNNYANREAIDIIRSSFNLDKTKKNIFNTSKSVKSRRTFKKFYLKLPLLFRPFMLFFVRLILQGAILEGTRGILWTTFQGLWYRLLVDLKICELKEIQELGREAFRDYVLKSYGYDIDKYE